MRRGVPDGPTPTTEIQPGVQGGGGPLGRVERGANPDHCAAIGIGKGTLSRWTAAAQPAPREGLSEDERSELARLRRENLQLKMERDILRKATAFFARESE
jgi:transposase-like protein